MPALPDTFEAWLLLKKVNAEAFASAQPALYTRYQDYFRQMGPVSFDHSHKFLINDWRLSWPLKA